MKKIKSEEVQKGPIAGQLVSAQHGWVALYEDKAKNIKYAIPIVAWRFYDFEPAGRESGSEYVCGSAVLIPTRNGDLIADSSDLIGYRWMPEIYSTPSDKDSDSPCWTLP